MGRVVNNIDPYRMLALHIVAVCDDQELKDVLNNTSVLKKLIREECRELDLAGPFLDTISEVSLSSSQKVMVRRCLDHLANELFECLDLERLRTSISRIINDL